MLDVRCETEDAKETTRACILLRLQDAGPAFGAIRLWLGALGLRLLARHPHPGDGPRHRSPRCMVHRCGGSPVHRREGSIVRRQEGGPVHRWEKNLGHHAPGSFLRSFPGYSVCSEPGCGPSNVPNHPPRNSAHHPARSRGHSSTGHLRDCEASQGSRNPSFQTAERLSEGPRDGRRACDPLGVLCVRAGAVRRLNRPAALTFR
jgi:hypothetical protein